MGAVIEFKRPEPVPEKPQSERITFIAEGGRKVMAMYLDSFDQCTRCLFDESAPADERQELLNRLRVHYQLEPLECPEARHEH